MRIIPGPPLPKSWNSQGARQQIGLEKTLRILSNSIPHRGPPQEGRKWRVEGISRDYSWQIGTWWLYSWVQASVTLWLPTYSKHTPAKLLSVVLAPWESVWYLSCLHNQLCLATAAEAHAPHQTHQHCSRKCSLLHEHPSKCLVWSKCAGKRAQAHSQHREPSC